MALDIRGSLKNTKINNNPYVVFYELLSNSIDSYLIRKQKEPSLDGLKVDFFIKFYDVSLEFAFDDKQNNKSIYFDVTCVDNGIGFCNEAVKAFVTKDTSYKDDLPINGLGKCRGSGRIQFLHYFSTLQIDSTYQIITDVARRTLSIDPSIKEVDENTFKDGKVNKRAIETSIDLKEFKTDTYIKILRNEDILKKFSAEFLKDHLMVHFLHRFVTLKKDLGNFHINFRTKYNKITKEATLDLKDLPPLTEKKEVLVYNHSNENYSKKFYILHYKLDPQRFKLKSNLVALCAKSSAVKNITNKFLKTKTQENNPIDGFYHIILIESEFLDEKVNPQRDDFEIIDEIAPNEMIAKDEISWEQIYESIDPILSKMLALPDWSKEAVIETIGIRYGITSKMISNAEVRIRHGDTEQKVVERVLHTYQTEIIRDTSEIFDIKEEISQADPLSQKFREKVNELAWKFTSSLEIIDMANLSQVVVRRAAILEILSLAINKGLLLQLNVEKKREDEKIIHNIFFPMGKDSKECKNHDIWLLNEEYYYYEYITSDRPLSKIAWDDQNLLFEGEIDAELEKIFRKKYAQNNKKRPDIAIFSKEGSAIIIELKSPDENLDEHVGDLMEYSQLLAAKSNGKLKKFYGYLVGNQVNPNRIFGYQKFPSEKGWFGTHPVVEHSNGKVLGELYSEILYYEDIVERAKKRLDVYKKRLDIDFSIKK